MSQSRLSQLLDQLGATAADVAVTLKSQGVRGVPNTARFLNPIVRFVRASIGGDGTTADVMQGDRLRVVHTDGTVEEAILPVPVRQFMDAFNHGQYPDLVMP